MAVDQNNGQVENYEHLLEDYSHFAPPAADEVLQGTVLGITAQRRHHRFRIQVRRPRSDRQFQIPDRRNHGTSSATWSTS